MNITSILKLATAFVAFSISAHAAEVFKVTTLGQTFPVTSPENFNQYTGDDPLTTGVVQVDGADYLLTADDITAGIVTIVSGDSSVDYVVSDTAVEGDPLEAVELGVLRAARLGINSITVATSDDDRDGVINRNDALPNNPLESVDSDSDGVGDNSDAHPGYNDSVISAGITQAVWDASQTALTTAQTAQATAEADLTTAQAALANSLTLSEVQDLRAGSTMIAVSGGSATVSLQMEESSDLSSWSNLGAAVPFTVTLDPSDVTKFYRVKLAD
jgi:hypothetical protein